MRFFTTPAVLLAWGLSAAAGHSYHAFEHGYEPVPGYGVIQKPEVPIQESQAGAVPYDDFSEVPAYYGGIDEFPPNNHHAFNSYMEPLGGVKLEDNSHYQFQAHNQQELHHYGHHNNHEHHGNYVVQQNYGQDVQHVNQEQYVAQDNKDEYQHSGNYVSFELHSGNGSHEEHDEKKHAKQQQEKLHEAKQNEKDNEEGDDGEHKSEAKYQFKYGVNDPKTGDVKEQWESRIGDKVKGGYALKEADGTTRVVHYSADKKKGFEATVQKIGKPKDTHSEDGHENH